MDEKLSRENLILKIIVKNFLETGTTVPSGKIAKSSQINLSSATIRSVMASLEEQGFLRKENPMSGRIPTQSGFSKYFLLFPDDYSLTYNERKSLKEASSITKKDVIGNYINKISKISDCIFFIRTAEHMVIGNDYVKLVKVSGKGRVFQVIDFFENEKELAKLFKLCVLEDVEGIVFPEKWNKILVDFAIVIQKHENFIAGFMGPKAMDYSKNRLILKRSLNYFENFIKEGKDENK